MTLPALLEGRLSVPVIGAPMFIVSGPELVLAQCRAGIVGSFPSLNARPTGTFERWLRQIADALTAADAPFAVNLIVHRSNARLAEDLALCVRYRVPIVITSLGARAEVADAVHGYGGVLLHDVISDVHARKAVERGADGIVAVAAGAGGHGGTVSPFALVQEIRRWFAGPLALSGAIANGRSIAAARALGADLAYVGSAFIATAEANAPDRYKQLVVDGNAADIVYSSLFTGVAGNYLRSSIAAAGLDPDRLPAGTPDAMDVADFDQSGAKAWRDIWGGGQGIGAIDAVVPAGDRVARFAAEYRAAIAGLAA